MSGRRSRVIANTQDVRLKALVRARNLNRPATTPVDFDLEDATFLAVIDAAEHLVKLIRIARIASLQDIRDWYRRLGVWNVALDALTSDFRNNESTATDALYRRLTGSREEF